MILTIDDLKAMRGPFHPCSWVGCDQSERDHFVVTVSLSRTGRYRVALREHSWWGTEERGMWWGTAGVGRNPRYYDSLPEAEAAAHRKAAGYRSCTVDVASAARRHADRSPAEPSGVPE